MQQRLLCLSLAVVAAIAGPPKCGDEVIRWTGSGNLEWPSPITENMYKNTSMYIPGSSIASRFAVWKDEVFLAFPRYKAGVPVTLAKLNLEGTECQPVLGAFPSWPMQQEGNCSALQSVVDVFLDQHGILWVLDSGILNYMEKEAAMTCPPKVIGVNVKNGQVVKKIEIGSLCNEVSRLQYMAVEYTSGDRAFVYVSDAANQAILVFDVSTGKGYRMVLPKAVSLGCVSRDVLYLGLLRKPAGDGQTRLIFSYFSSSHLFAIQSTHLMKGTPRGKVEEIGAKDKFVFLGTDDDGLVFFRKEDQPTVYAWKVMDASAPVHRIYAGGVNALPTQLVVDRKGQIRLLESNFPDYFRGTHGDGVNHTLRIL